TMLLGGRVGITGKVIPHLQGIRVTLQQGQGRNWFSMGDKAIGSDGAFSFLARPGKTGTSTYRVVTTKGTDFTGTSASVSIKVLRWSYLGDIYAKPVVGDLSPEPALSHGVT